MKSPHYFLVKPVNGRRYDNIKNWSGIEFITSSSKEDHMAANRYAVVLEVPIGYPGPVKKGDELIVHHNVFKFYNDVKGREKSGRSFLKDDIFMIDEDQFYLYKNDSGWNAHSKYCFIKPEAKVDDYILSKRGSLEHLRGVVVYPNAHLVSIGIFPGDRVSYTPESEYIVEVDGEKLYRMYSKNICIKFDGDN
jgi:hypothetical protein